MGNDRPECRDNSASQRSNESSVECKVASLVKTDAPTFLNDSSEQVSDITFLLKKEDRCISTENAATALKMGLINWFQFFELVRTGRVA